MNHETAIDSETDVYSIVFGDGGGDDGDGCDGNSGGSSDGMMEMIYFQLIS